MIAQVVFDLPIDGPFDYLIPENLAAKIMVGMRVKTSFGYKAQMGYVTGLLESSPITKLKPIQSACDNGPVFNGLDLTFARQFCAYYGCSLGEALGTMLRNKVDLKLSRHLQGHKPSLLLYRCPPDTYVSRIKEIIKGHPMGQPSQDPRFLILVPDIYTSKVLAHGLKDLGPVKIGMRSSVFESDARYDCVIMVDDEDDSYKQEQAPMYDTRQVLLMRSGIYGFDAAFMGLSPSVELMALASQGKIKLIEDAASQIPRARIIDLTNYKYIPGLISPPVRDALEANLKRGFKSILVLNRRGSYRLTRCVDCGGILKCQHCDSPLIYSRHEGKYLCRHCTFTAPGDIICPQCQKPSWRSVGIGVEQVQIELKKIFPQARTVAFERQSKNAIDGFNAKAPKSSQPADAWADANALVDGLDILVCTSAVLRFQGAIKVQTAAFIDFDAELNRLDMRSGFNAFSLGLHIGSMAQDPVFIQTRNSNHYVPQYLSRANIKGFYDEELKLRQEHGFSPFKHWIKISWRGKVEKKTLEISRQAYQLLSQSAPECCLVTPPLADVVGRKRGQFRFNVMVQADQVISAMFFIKSTLAKIRRLGGVIVTFNIDP